VISAIFLVNALIKLAEVVDVLQLLVEPSVYVTILNTTTIVPKDASQEIAIQLAADKQSVQICLLESFALALKDKPICLTKPANGLGHVVLIERL